jgi:hypothetical protein
MNFSEQERRIIADTDFFPAKAAITDKVKALLSHLREELKQELAVTRLAAPDGLDTTHGQLVKGEHLLDFPYQYLDFPKYFSLDEMFTFRTLVWWGHHIVFALMLNGRDLDRYKEQFLRVYDQLADQELHLLMTETPWEWRRGDDYVLPITRKNRAQVIAAVAARPFLKIHRIVDFDHPAFAEGRLAAEGVATFRLMARIASP